MGAANPEPLKGFLFLMIKDIFVFKANEWLTPNTYDTNFKPVPASSGVYLLVRPVLDSVKKKYIYNILYVGSSKSLSIRYRSHEVLRILTETYGYIQFYFKEEEDYKEVEKNLINIIQPKYNKQWR
jgi:excinuclease UvrABC nuclease subunit